MPCRKGEEFLFFADFFSAGRGTVEGDQPIEQQADERASRVVEQVEILNEIIDGLSKNCVALMSYGFSDVLNQPYYPHYKMALAGIPEKKD